VVRPVRLFSGSGGAVHAGLIKLPAKARMMKRGDDADADADNSTPSTRTKYHLQ
jgi:hypothetical protein